MKQAKLLTVVLLLAALLLSSCALAVPTAKEVPAETVVEMIPQIRAEETAGEASPAEEAAPLADAPQGGYYLQPLAAGGGMDAVTKDAKPLFKAKFEGDKVEGSGEAVDGVYRFAATKTDGEAWHVKLESNYPTVAGRDYQVTYRFTSDVAGKVKFGDFQEFEIQKGDNSVTGMMIATSGTSYLDLQLGMLPPFTIEFSEIEIEEYADEVEYEDALPRAIDFENEAKVYEKHDQGYAPIPTRSKDEVNINYFSAPWDPGVWKSRLYVKTGLIPESGVRYHITADVESDMDMPFEILFNDGDVEKGYGALYGQNLTAGEKKTCEAVINGASEGEELVIQFSLGQAPEDANVKVGNVHIETITDHYKSLLPANFAMDKEVYTGRTLTSLVPTAYKNIPLNVAYSGIDTVWERHDDDYEANLEERSDSATLHITKAPENDRGVWKAQLFAQTDVVLEEGKSYIIQLDVKGSKDQGEYEVCFDGDYENAYGIFRGRSLKAGETDHIEHFITSDVAHGPLKLRLQLGKTDSTAGNDITLSGFSIQEAQTTAKDIGSQSYDTGSAAQETDVAMPGFAYPVTTGGSSQHVDDAWESKTLTLSASQIAWENSAAQASVLGSDSAKLEITAPSQQADAPWTIRLHVGTGITLEPGKQYKVEANFSATDPTGKWECKLSNGPADVDGDYPNQYGSGYGYVMDTEDQTATISKTFTVPGDLPCSELVLRFDLGRSGTNTITVSGIKVSEFIPAHDEITDPVTNPNSFALEPRNGNDTSDALLTGDGNSATVKVTVPSPSDQDWHIKLIANTGAELQTGKKYVISMKVNAVGGGDWPIAFRRDMEGDHDYDFSPDASVNPDDKLEFLDGGIVRNTVTARYDGKLQIVLKLGKRAADSTITVSDISIKEITGGGGGHAPINFWAHEDYSASASNTASSATLKVASAPESGREGWKVKFFAETGVQLEPGRNYRVLADVASSKPLDYEICYNRDEHEKGFGDTAKYGLHADTAATTESYDFSPTEAGQLILQFSVGNAVSDTEITISNIKVQELTAEPGENLLSGFRYDSLGSVSDASDDGYITSLEKKSDSAVFHIHQAPAADRHPWNVKLNVKTGFTPENGKGYRVSFDIAAEKPQAVAEVFYDGNRENAYGQLFNRSLSAGKQNISFTTRPVESNGELTLQIRLGQTDGTSGNTYTVSNVKVEEVTFTSYSTPEKLDTVTLRTEAGYKSQLDKTADRATVRVEKTPSAGLEAWKTKLFVETGVTLKAGQKYRIRMDVKSIIPAPFEVCFNDGAEEKGLGAMFGLMSAPTGQPVEYVTYPRKDIHLVIQLSLGNCTSPNSIILSNLAVEKAGTINLVSDTIYEF